MNLQLCIIIPQVIELSIFGPTEVAEEGKSAISYN